jgi:hypothetical protein
VAEAVAVETTAAKAAQAALRGVDEETLQVLLRPGQDPRAADVFLDFTSYRYATCEMCVCFFLRCRSGKICNFVGDEISC